MLLKFMKGAIEDWKAGNISSGRLFEIFRVNYYEAYNKLLDEQGKTNKWLDIPTKRIAEILLSCDMVMCIKSRVIPNPEKGTTNRTGEE